MNLLNPPSLNTAYYTVSKYLHIISYALLHTIHHIIYHIIYLFIFLPLGSLSVASR